MNKLLSKKIKNFRINYGWTQTEIANKLNISQSTYQRIERGVGSSYHYYLSSIAALYGIEENEFLHSSNNSEKDNSPSESDYQNRLSKLITIYENLILEKEKNTVLLEKLLEQKEKYIQILESKF